MAEVSIRVEKYGDAWMAIVIDEEANELAVAMGPREQAVTAACEEARSYLAGEDGWE